MSLDVDLVHLITAAGYLGVAGVIFAESGLLIGLLFPGDSLLFTAGFLASAGTFDIRILIPLCFLAAVLGDSTGYAFGRRLGPKIFRRDNSLFFHKDNLDRAHAFYAKHGPKAIVLARFMPVIRTFAPMLAGVGRMHYPLFLTYNIVGAVTWAVCVPLLGYFLGQTIPNVDRYLTPMIIAIILTSVAPSIWHLLRDREERKRCVTLVCALARKASGRSNSVT